MPGNLPDASRWPVCGELAHTPACGRLTISDSHSVLGPRRRVLPGTDDGPAGMLVNEGLRNVTIPAHRLHGGEGLLQVLRRQAIPLLHHSFLHIEQRRGMLEMAHLDGMAAVGAVLALIPLSGNGPHPARFGVLFDLAYARLGAITALRPARAGA